MDPVNHITLTLQPSQVRSTLRGILVSIFFHRTVGDIEPEDYEIEGTYVSGIASVSLNKEIDARVDEFCREFLDTGAERGEIAVVFLQKKPRKNWFVSIDELIPWEEHLITVNVRYARPGDRPPRSVLPKALMQLLMYCASNKSNVPPLSTATPDGGNNMSHQIMIAPPPPSDIFAPSPPMHPARLTSPPPPAIAGTTAATIRGDLTLPPASAATEAREAKRSSSPAAAPATAGGAFGYFEQAKDGLRAVGARAGAVAGWTGRAAGRP